MSLSGLIDATSLSWVGRQSFLALAASAVFSIGLFAVSMGRRILIAAAVLAFLASNEIGRSGQREGKSVCLSYHCNNAASGFVALIDADRFMTRYEVQFAKIVYIWWDKNEVLHDPKRVCLFVSLAFLFRWRPSESSTSRLHGRRVACPDPRSSPPSRFQ